MKNWIRNILIVLALIIMLCAFGIPYAIEHILPYSPIRPFRLTKQDIVKVFSGDPTPAAAGLAFSEFDITVEDTIVLKGWFVYAKQIPAKGTVFLLHGIANSRVGMITTAATLASAGLNCILYDSRANGESGGINCTFGYYEKHDLSLYIDSAQARFPYAAPFAVFGNSLGAAVAIQAMAVDKRLVCGIVESPFASLREVIHDYFRRILVLPIYSIPDAALIHSEHIAHFQVDSVRPEISALSLTQPIMVVHGLEDAHISADYGFRVFANIASKEKVWYPMAGGTHYNLAKVGGDRYRQAIVEFFQKHLH